MAESGESKRFEVELTSNGAAPGWARSTTAAADSAAADSPAVDFTAAGDVESAQALESASIDDGPTPERGRLLGLVALVVAALGLGWMLGRSGDPSDASAEQSSLTTVESEGTSTPSDGTIAPVASIAPVEPVVSSPDPSPVSAVSEPAAAPTTIPPSIEESATTLVELAPSVKGMPIEIVALGSGRRIISLDLSTGTLDAREIDSQPFGPPTLFVDEDSILLPSWDADLPSTLLRDGAEPASVDVGPAPRLLSTHGSGVLWRSDFAPVGFEAARSEPIGLDGTPLGAVLDLPVFPLSADPAGGVVVAAPGGAFQVTSEGSTKITPGRLAALGPDHAIGHECDETLVCRYVVIERATGSRAPLLLDAALGEQPFFDTRWGPVSVSAFSPAGTFVAVEWAGVETDFVRTLVVLDLRSGSAIELGVDPDSVQYAWSDDGRVLLYLLGGRLSALDVASGESDLVSDDLFGVETFALRPLTP